MIPNFAKKELLSALWIKRALVPCTISGGDTIDTYDASPQPAGGVDTWDGGALRFRNLLIVADVASFSEAGSLALTLRDSSAAITTANGAASTAQAFALTSITAAGLYVAEVRLTHVFPAASARVVADAGACEIERYISLRAAATTANIVMSAWFVFGNNLNNFPVQDATRLSVTWSDS